MAHVQGFHKCGVEASLIEIIVNVKNKVYLLCNLFMTSKAPKWPLVQLYTWQNWGNGHSQAFKSRNREKEG